MTSDFTMVAAIPTSFTFTVQPSGGISSEVCACAGGADVEYRVIAVLEVSAACEPSGSDPRRHTNGHLVEHVCETD